MKGICPWSLVRSRIIISCSGLKNRWRIKKKRKKKSCWQIRNNSSSRGFDSSVEKKKKKRLKNLTFSNRMKKVPCISEALSSACCSLICLISTSLPFTLSSPLCNPDFWNVPRSQSTSSIFSSLSLLVVASLDFSLASLPSSLYPSLSISLLFAASFVSRRSPSSRQGCHGDVGSLACVFALMPYVAEACRTLQCSSVLTM